MKIITVCTQKGGAGKTSSSIEIASDLVYFGKKVLLIDLDQQANATNCTNLDETVQYSIHDVLTDKCDIVDAIHHTPYYDFIMASSALSGADVEFYLREKDDPDKVAEFALIDKLDDERLNYDYVIIDTNPGRNILLQQTYCASDYVIIPTEADKNSFDGITAIYTDIKKLRDRRVPLSNAKVLAFILTKFESNTGSHKAALESLQETASLIPDNPIVATVRKSIKVSDCKDFNMPLLEYEKYNNAAVDYRSLTKQIIERVEGECK